MPKAKKTNTTTPCLLPKSAAARSAVEHWRRNQDLEVLRKHAGDAGREIEAAIEKEMGPAIRVNGKINWFDHPRWPEVKSLDAEENRLGHLVDQEVEAVIDSPISSPEALLAKVECVLAWENPEPDTWGDELAWKLIKQLRAVLTTQAAATEKDAA